jgi:hypothetical protein
MQLGDSGAVRHGIASGGAIPTDASAGLSRYIESNALVLAGRLYTSRRVVPAVEIRANRLPLD